jgi:hypothetical protein
MRCAHNESGLAAYHPLFAGQLHDSSGLGRVRECLVQLTRVETTLKIHLHPVPSTAPGR